MSAVALLALAVAAPASGQDGHPRLEAYRFCGARFAARLNREQPKVAADVLARNATLRCDPLLGAAVEETLASAGLPQGRAQAMNDFRQRSVADLAFRISTLRASRKGAAK